MSGFEFIGDVLNGMEENSTEALDGSTEALDGSTEALDGSTEALAIGETTENGIISSVIQEIKEIIVRLFDRDGGEETSEVIVTGDPYGWAQVLDWEQGDVYSDVTGDCGLVSSANFLKMCGINVDEQEMINTAISYGLCNYSQFDDPSSNGGTNCYDREQLLELYGVDVTVVEAGTPEGSIDSIANALENGQPVMISVNAGYLWDDANYVGDGSSNHVITVTGVERNAETGEVTGLIICDSGRGLQSDACRTLSIDVLKDCYLDAPGCTAIIADSPRM